MPELEMDWGDISSWIAVVFTLYGLIVQQRSASRSKNERKRFQHKIRIETMLQDIDELTSRALNYWTSVPAATTTDGVLIVSKLRDIGSRLQNYKHFLWEDVIIDFTQIRTSMTGGQFQASSRTPLQAESPLIRRFMDASCHFKIQLRKAYDRIDIDD